METGAADPLIGRFALERTQEKVNPRRGFSIA